MESSMPRENSKELVNNDDYAFLTSETASSESDSVLTLCDEFYKYSSDSNVFKVVDFINARFPTESSLTNLDSFLSKVKAAVGRLDSELSEKVTKERYSSEKCSKDIYEAKEKLIKLKSDVASFSEKAIAAEEQLNAVCLEIRSLETARKNVSSSLDAIKKLQDFEAKVNACEKAWRERDWKTCGEIVPSLSNLSKMFEELEEFQGLGKIPVLLRRSKEIIKSLQEKIPEEFRSIGVTGIAEISSNSERQVSVNNLTAMCKIIDHISPECRNQIIEWYINSRLSAYEAVFGPGGEAASIEASEKRFAWLRRELRYFDEHWSNVFPSHWNLPLKFASAFCSTTRKHLILELEKRKIADVTILLRVLQKTIDFENELEKRFSHGTFEYQQGRRFSNLSAVSDESEATDDSKGSRNFVGSISACFEPAETRNGGSWSVESPSTVLKSSTELFLQIKRCMKRCGALTTSQTFFNLHKVFKKHLKAYANALGDPIAKQGRSPTTSSGFSFVSKETFLNSNISLLELTEEEERTICSIISTAEYCASTVEQLSSTIRRKVDPVYAPNVQMDIERDEFRAVAARGLRALSIGVYTRLQKHLNAMPQNNWSNITSVGDSSPYVSKLEEELYHTLPRLAHLLSFAHFRYFCDRLVAIFIPSYMMTLKTCKKVSSIGAQQLLLDASAIKNLLQKIPSIAYQDMDNRRKQNREFINKEMTKAELILKVLLSPLESIVATYVALISDNSVGELNQLLEMKGLKKAAAAPYIVQYTQLTGKDSHTPLVSSSKQESNMSSKEEKTMEKQGVLNRLVFLLSFDNLCMKINLLLSRTVLWLQQRSALSTRKLHSNTLHKAVVLLSGGVDSATCLAIASKDGFRIHALSFDYGQRHKYELNCAASLAKRFSCVEHRTAKVDLTVFGGSALTSLDIDVPKDRKHRSSSIPVTYVPARNTIFLSYALAYAEVIGSSDIFIGANVIDYSGYPDCRPEYFEAFEKLAAIGTKAGVEGLALRIHTPLLRLSKEEIIQKGLQLGVDYSLTHSCYDPEEEGKPCLHCDACLIRQEAFQKLGYKQDPVLDKFENLRPTVSTKP
eukprot:jgi/Galph1/5088/GphlegSOOS_G3760.1